MKVIGLDIGTTTICAIVIETISGEVLKTVTANNNTQYQGSDNFEKIQNPDLILSKCETIIKDLTDSFAPVACIGVTGQMHGIVYFDKSGNSVSPLYFWQDESGNEPYNDHQSYAEYLSEITGHKMSTGFGCTTYFYHTKKSKVPLKAVGFCTIHDYIVMKLCSNKKPLVHTTDAASFGLFDLSKLNFDKSAIEISGLDYNFFPQVTKDFDIAGYYKDIIPVSVAIGDNQASFLGSVCDMKNALLINVGTGSQISYLTDDLTSTSDLEIRPCFGNNFLCVGSSLCGGRAFALLEEFLRKTVLFCTGNKIDSLYPAIDLFLSDSIQPLNPLEFSTRFCGTRNNPDERGMIKNIGLDNFTPQHFIFGVLNGMVEELLAMYKVSGNNNHNVIIGSGNGLRKNHALQKLFSQSFGVEMKIPSHNEEAAFGTALFALTATNFYNTIYDAQKIIKYR